MAKEKNQFKRNKKEKWYPKRQESYFHIPDIKIQVIIKKDKIKRKMFELLYSLKI